MLLEDSSQTSQKTWYFSHIFSSKHIIRKGELIQKTESDQWVTAYSESPISIDCRENHIKFVDPVFVPYLLAVENLNSRYNLFINELNSLSHNVLLNVGDKVDVMIEQQVIPTAGTVKYIGNLPGKKGIFFGIEITVSQNYTIYVNT